MFYVIRVKGWPALVWLEVRPAPGRYDVLGTFDDLLHAAAGFHDAVERARAAMHGPITVSRIDLPVIDARRHSGAPVSNTMSPLPPAWRKRATYDSAR